jgi:amino acid adenylation domain-containing protein
MTKNYMKLPPEQQAIRDKCFHSSGTFVEFPMEDTETSIPERFEKMVQLYPKRPAVKTRTEELTYEELNHAANRVAHALSVSGDARSEPVALLLPKSTTLVIAILGTLKTGKICVQMDPTFPPARLALMFEHMQARLLIVNRASMEVMNSFARNNRFLNIDDLDLNGTEKTSATILRPDHLACIFYTSGSTGSPKGVIENHRNLLHGTMRDTNEYHICAEDKLALVASSGKIIFRALLNGAAVHPLDIRQDGFDGLGRMLIDEEITILNCVTSAFRNFVRSLAGRERFPHLRLIRLTGETLYWSDYELYRKHFSDTCVFVNAYGPNEAGTISQYLMDKNIVRANEVVPAGYAVPDKEIQLVDESGNRVSVGQRGKIVVKSRYMSLGYWLQPERTAAAFQAEPLDNQIRVYHTGDIGTMQADGCLVHMGRQDFQVKIRGNKVEMPAVETALQNLETVREAAVVALDDETGDKRLVAYIVARTHPAPTSSELREALKAVISEFMIPSAFVVLDKLPVTGTGKVDRRALTTPSKSRPQLSVFYVAPRTVHEEKLAAVWAEVLDLVEVGVFDNFFHLGGHSLAASRIVARVIQMFQVELPVTALFESPTVADMARVISEYQARQANPTDLDRMLTDIEAMSVEEAQQRVEEMNSRIPNK